MIGGINSNVNAVQLLNAVNAFKNTASTPVQPQKIEPEVSSGVNIADNSLLKSQNIEEIKKYAQMMGEANLSEEDIKYGLSYGRSVIVEYSA